MTVPVVPRKLTEGNLLLGLWGSAGLRGGETEGSSTEERDIQAVPGNSKMSAEAREKGCSKQREICARLGEDTETPIPGSQNKSWFTVAGLGSELG